MPESAARTRLGSSGLEVSLLSLGTNVFTWTVDRKTSFDILDAYVDAGGNFIDTADLYTAWAPGNVGGESETVIGEWLKRRGRRDDVIIATKVGMGSEDLEKGLTRRHIIAGCEASLRRLQIDRIDLYYAHQDYPEPPLEETLGALNEIVRAGKVRTIGASNYSAARLREALELSRRGGLTPYTVLQQRLNLVERTEFDEELQAVCAAYDVGVAAHSALAGGFLTGKYRPDAPLPPSVRSARIGTTLLADEVATTRLAVAESVAERHGVQVVEVALAWALAQPGVQSVIASASSTEQLELLAASTTLELSGSDLRELATA
jgi:aryl-alcohol dehydrogenase (NADP+)